MNEIGYRHPPEPVDSDWDIHYPKFELWLNYHYDMESQSIFGNVMSWDDACESDDLFAEYLDMAEDVA